MLAAKPVLWCEPTDLEYTRGPDGFPPARLLQVKNAGSPVLMYDGQVRYLKSTISPQMLFAAIAPDGDEIVNLDD